MKKPIIGITMGDPFGNGPEITIKTLSNSELYNKCRPVVFGDAKSLEYASKISKLLGRQELYINKIQSINEAKFEFGTVDVIDHNLVNSNSIPVVNDANDIKPFGIGPCKEGGEASFQYIKSVIEHALEGKIDATVTNAISKEAINEAGHHYSGHTEIYADFTNTQKYTMMLAHGDLRVVHVSTHVSLLEACARVKKKRVLDVIRIANEGCKALGIKEPKIAVAGLNPHCGENGLFGREEIEEIQPAIDEAILEGINVRDKKPTPPDTVFSKARGGWYDVVVAMYHDQGHIPLKVVGFVYNRDAKKWDAVEGVNITLGLPIIRVSVDHGTGFGHAGSGQANELSLINAIDYAIQFANAKNEQRG